MSQSWQYSAQDVFATSPVVPVLVIKKLEHAVPLAKALIAGGINILEVTLRTPVALEAIELIAKELPDAMIGAGTVTNAEQLQQVTDVGAKFAISPGMTAELLAAGQAGSIALIPGISSTSDLMRARDAGYTHLKFVPAEAVGGVKAIKSIAGPVPDMVFCPTGGISLSNYHDYLALPNIHCVGGSWLAPDALMDAGDWDAITQLAKEAVEGAKVVA